MSGQLNHSQAKIIAQLLIGAGAGSVPVDNQAWPIFSINEPDQPDNCITIYNTQGVDHGRFQTSGETQLHHGLQARIRGEKESIAYAKAYEIYEAFDKVVRNQVSVDMDTYHVQAVNNQGDILPIGLEAATSRRHLFTINALADIRLL